MTFGDLCDNKIIRVGSCSDDFTVRIFDIDIDELILQNWLIKETKLNLEKLNSTLSIKDFTGTITSVTDKDYNVFLVGRSDDGLKDFFTVALWE